MSELFMQSICADLHEFFATRKLQQALDLTAQTGQHFNHNEYPMYFTGKLDAKLVLIHLNPKQPNNTAATYTGPFWLKDVDAYRDYHQHFGRILYGPQAARTHTSPFDHKQIRFLKPFDVIPFVEEQNPDDRYMNLERVIDDKLQLELIPYGSASFRLKGFTHALLAPYLERLLSVISAYPRDYILFCGQIFAGILRDFLTDTHEFKLTKKDGTVTQHKTRFSTIQLPYNGKVLHAGLAHSFAQQGIPMAAYGRQCKALYRQ